MLQLSGVVIAVAVRVGEMTSAVRTFQRPPMPSQILDELKLRNTTEGDIHCAKMAVPRARVLDLMKVRIV